MHSFSVVFAQAPEAGKAVLARRVEEEAAIVRAQQARLADVRRELGGLAALDADTTWVGRTLERFDKMWDALRHLGDPVPRVVTPRQLGRALSKVSPDQKCPSQKTTRGPRNTTSGAPGSVRSHVQ